VFTEFRKLADEPSCSRPNGAVQPVPKLLRSIVNHNPNVFMSPTKPKCIGMFDRHCSLFANIVNLLV